MYTRAKSCNTEIFISTRINSFRAGSRDYEAERRFSGSADRDRERDRGPRAFSAMGRRRRSSQDLHRKLTHIAQSFDRPRRIRYAKQKKHQTHKDLVWQLILRSCTQKWKCMIVYRKRMFLFLDLKLKLLFVSANVNSM